MSSEQFESDEDLYSQDLNSTGDLKGFSYWPVQVCKVDEDAINLVYYETGETNCVPMPGAELVPFTEETIANLKLDQLKNKKLQKAIAAARASV